MFVFGVEACDPDYCVRSLVEIDILAVDEYPPQFLGTNPDLGFEFSVPYASLPGHVVGEVRKKKICSFVTFSWCNHCFELKEVHAWHARFRLCSLKKR